MYLDSLHAIRQILEAAVPETDVFYIEAVPATLTLPAFYLEHMASGTELLGAYTIQFHVQWRIGYIPELLPDGTPDTMNQLAVMDLLREAFHQRLTLEAAGGTVFQLTEFSGGSGDMGMYAAVKLQTQYIRAEEEPEYEPIGAVHMKGI